MKKVLIVADDITGGDDIGVMYSRSSHPTVLYPYFQQQRADFGDYSKLVVDTDSRFVAPDEAYRRVYNLVKQFEGCGVQQFFNKQCSVFRGNIGAEFDAMLDATGVSFAPVILGFPDNGRTTLHNIHYIHGVPLAQSQFRNDPVNPMNESNLIVILSSQTKRPVSAVHYEHYAAGKQHLQELLQQRKADGGYLIFDVRDNNDLALLADVLQDEPVICGSSAIAYYLGLADPNSILPTPSTQPPTNNTNVLCIAGSLTPQTLQQLEHARLQGHPQLTLQTLRLFDETERRQELERLRTLYSTLYGSDPMIVIKTSNTPDEVAQTKQLAARLGLTEAAAASVISDTLALLTSELAQSFDLQQMIVCGGDTSASFCRKFGVAGMIIGQEIESGVPICISADNPSLRFVLKSGSFGSSEFLEKALLLLRSNKED